MKGANTQAKIGYGFEFMTKKRKRKFNFGDPDLHYQFNKEQHNDTRYFKMYLDLLRISKNVLDTETYIKVNLE